MITIYKMSDSVSILKESNSSCGATSIPRHDESASEFGDWCCGEPLKTQHVAVDFTPSEELDTEFVQNKCFAFWDFVSNSLELQDLKDLIKYPKTEQESSDVLVDVYSQCAGSMSSKSNPCEKNRTALSMLEVAGQRGMVSETFEIRLPNATSCSLGFREYREIEPTAAACKKPNNKSVCKCECGKCKSCKSSHPKGSIPQSSSEVKRLNKVMRQWDYNHPKSMEPPGRTPQLSHSQEKSGLDYS